MLDEYGRQGATATDAAADPRWSSGQKTDDRFYRPELDGLRFFAFLSVFCAHAFLPVSANVPQNPITNSGNFGVCLFFLLSSYLITELLLRERRRTGKYTCVPFTSAAF